MKQIALSTDIKLSQAEVFDYLADVANLAEFQDHYLVDWHLLRENSRGVGAGARFKLLAPANRFSWAELTYFEVQAPTRIVARGDGGKFNRIPFTVSVELSERDGKTHVELKLGYEVKLPSDRLYWAFPGGPWLRSNVKHALKRLGDILEHDALRGKRPVPSAKRAVSVSRG